MSRKPRYRWVESHGAWMRVKANRHRWAPVWLFPKGFQW